MSRDTKHAGRGPIDSWLALVIGLLWPATAQAEVMDKEPSLLALWVSGLVGGAVGFAACRAKPIYGVATLPLPALLFWVQFQELDDPFVGPAILQEAGAVYFWSSGYAAALVVLGHLAGIGGWCRRSPRRLHRADHP